MQIYVFIYLLEIVEDLFVNDMLYLDDIKCLGSGW